MAPYSTFFWKDIFTGMMKDEITQDSFVASTQNDCKLLSATGSVHWEWFYGWLQAFGGYFPKYATQEGENLDSEEDVLPVHFLSW